MMHHPRTTQVKVRPAIPTAFQQFEARDRSFNDSIVPIQDESRLDGLLILTPWVPKRASFGETSRKRCVEPLFQVFAPAISEHLGELLEQGIERDDGLGDGSGKRGDVPDALFQ